MNEKIIEQFGNISTEPIYAAEITKENLEIANSLTFGIFFCSSEVKLLKFYRELFETFSLETTLKVLARILTDSKEKKLTYYYNIAKVLFDKSTKLMNLRNKDIVILTTSATDLDPDTDLGNPRFMEEISRSN